MKFMAIAAAFAVVGCTPNVNTSTPSIDVTLTQEVLAAETAYEGVLDVALLYKKRPPCPAVVLCQDPAVLAWIRTTNHKIMSGFATAMDVASKIGATKTDVDAALAAVTVLIGTLQAAVVPQKAN